MTWSHLSELLCREFRTLRRMAVVNFGFASAPVFHAAHLRDEELRSAARVDRIILNFARGGRWPALDERERFFLRERIRFAYEYCGIAETIVTRPLLIAGRADVPEEQRRLVEWVLIDVWRNAGVHQWLHPLFVLTSAPPRPRPEPVWHLAE